MKTLLVVMLACFGAAVLVTGSSASSSSDTTPTTTTPSTTVPDAVSVSCMRSESGFTIVDGIQADAVAWGQFYDTVLSTGWGELTVKTSGAFSDFDQFFCAGKVEGALTAARIVDMYKNLLYSNWGNTDAPPKNVVDWLVEQDAWARSMVNANENDPLWEVVGLLLAQLDGLVEGFEEQKHVDGYVKMLMLNAAGDLFDLIPALNITARPDYYSMSADEVKENLAQRGHCSGFVKITPDYSDIFMAHSTWWTFGAMTRIMKHFSFAVANPNVANHELAYSSYPGFLESLDDYYEMRSGPGHPQSNMVMIETTNSIINMSVYDIITPQSLVAWQRVRAASHMSHNGTTWCNILARYNSGTYNNQYMVVDLDLFTPNEALLPGTLVVCEQMPGLVVTGDQTEALELGYWPSYNVPAYEAIWIGSGYAPLVDQPGGEQFTWDLAHRAMIFRRNQTDVVDIESLQALMRYNDYEHDPLSQGSPWNAICSRGDLASPSVAFGCLDSKVSNVTMAVNLEMYAISGPTSVQQPVFSWTEDSSYLDATAHYGMAQSFEFPFQYFKADFDLGPSASSSSEDN